MTSPGCYSILKTRLHETGEQLGNDMDEKGVFGRPSGASREGPGVRQKIVSDTKQMTKERKTKKKRSGKREKMYKEKENGRKRGRK